MAVNEYQGVCRLTCTYKKEQYQKQHSTLTALPHGEQTRFVMESIAMREHIVVDRAMIRRIYDLMVDTNQMLFKLSEKIKSGKFTMTDITQEVTSIAETSKKGLAGVPFLQG
jgi:protein gp37